MEPTDRFSNNLNIGTVYYESSSPIATTENNTTVQVVKLVTTNDTTVENGWEPDAVDTQTEFGDDPSLKLIDRSNIKIRYKAKFRKLCSCFACDYVDYSRSRKYFWVLENGVEMNYPMTAQLCCFTLPPNCLCPGNDCIIKSYFDRGIFDQQNCCFKIGCLSGKPKITNAIVKNVCCCVDCCECYNQCRSGFHPCCCGEVVAVVPFETYCFCCPMYACWIHNCFGLCGPKDGQPLFLKPFAVHLGVGEADKVAHAVNKSREAWSLRTGIN